MRGQGRPSGAFRSGYAPPPEIGLYYRASRSGYAPPPEGSNHLDQGSNHHEGEVGYKLTKEGGVPISIIWTVGDRDRMEILIFHHPPNFKQRGSQGEIIMSLRTTPSSLLGMAQKINWPPLGPNTLHRVVGVGLHLPHINLMLDL